MLIGEAMDQNCSQNEDQYTKVALAPQTLNTVRIVLAYHFEDVDSLMYLLAECDSFQFEFSGAFYGLRSEVLRWDGLYGLVPHFRQEVI
jgi:hypothetical protein